MTKANKKLTSEELKKIDSLKKQIFDLKLSKNISGSYDKKKIKELKNQVISLYSLAK